MNLMISTNELADLLGIPKRQASKVIKAVNEDLAKQGVFVFNTRPMKAPTEWVFKKLHMKVPE